MRAWIRILGMVVSLVVACAWVAPAMAADTLEPKLLWKKEYKGYTSIKVARESGHVIKGGYITVYDKTGRTVMAWGPRIDRHAYDPDISDDGTRVLFTTRYTEEYVEETNQKTSDERVHYMTSRGVELWNRLTYPGATIPLPPAFFGSGAFLSPDGRYVALVSLTDPDAGFGGYIELWDENGKTLWVRETGTQEGFKFSPDSKYLVGDLGGGGACL